MRYVTIEDARFAVREVIYDVAHPASLELVELVAEYAWRHQETVDAALKALAKAGVDCEGFDTI
jgi:Ran GTPase-activating protein (RanGAP) involved in mRNA processing and transport